MKLYEAAMEFDRVLGDLQYEFENNNIVKGEKFKEIIEDEIDEDLIILVDNNKIKDEELEDDIYYKYIGVSNVEQEYYSSELCNISYYLFKFKTVEE